jgi:hypothetical protein
MFLFLMLLFLAERKHFFSCFVVDLDFTTGSCVTWFHWINVLAFQIKGDVNLGSSIVCVNDC